MKSTLTLWPNERQIKPLTRSQKKYEVQNTQLATHINRKNTQGKQILPKQLKRIFTQNGMLHIYSDIAHLPYRCRVICTARNCRFHARSNIL